MTSTGTLWQQKRLELAGQIKEERSNAEASRHIFQHERAEKNRRLHHQETDHRPRAGQQQSGQQQLKSTSAFYTAAASTLSTFSDVCNNRGTAPPLKPATWEGPPTSLTSGPTTTLSHFPASSTQSMQAATGGYGMSHAGNVKWYGSKAGPVEIMSNHVAFHSAPVGFPLRQLRGGRAGGKSGAEDTREWAGLAATMSSNRGELDRLLIERVAMLAQAAAPQKKLPGAPKLKKGGATDAGATVPSKPRRRA